MIKNWKYPSLPSVYPDDVALGFGPTKVLWETADSNANLLGVILPEGGAVDVPVAVFGDTSIDNVDLGIFDGITQPTIAIMDKAGKYAAVANATSTGANATLTTATAGTFTNAVAGDIVRVTAGTNATAGWYTIASVTSGVEIVLHATWCTGAVTGGTIVCYHPYTMYTGSGVVSKGAFVIQTNGDTDDFITITTVADIPTITATGATHLAFGSDISIGANKLKTTNLLLRQESATRWGLFLADDVTASNLLIGAISPQNADFMRVPVDAYIATYANDDRRFGIRVQDNGVGIVEIIGFQSAANPYVQIGRDDTGVSLNTITDGLVLQMGAGANNEAAGFGFGTSWKIGNASSEVEERGSIDLVLDTATNGAENAHFVLGTMLNGVMNKSLDLGWYQRTANQRHFINAEEGTTNYAGTHLIPVRLVSLITQTSAVPSLTTHQTLYVAHGVDSGSVDQPNIGTYGVRSAFSYTTNTNISQAFDFYSDAYTSGTGIVDQYFHFATGANADDGGTVNTEYGLYVSAMIHGTTKWGVYIVTDPSYFGGGLHIGATSTNNLFDDASTGAGTTAMFIGNAQITAVSDIRIKTDIEPTKVNALDALNTLHIIDFHWDDPSDRNPFGKSIRGRWTGISAQELIKVAPYVINAEGRFCPDCLAGLPCSKHGLMFVEYEQMVPVLIKAIQELTARLVLVGG